MTKKILQLVWIEMDEMCYSSFDALLNTTIVVNSGILIRLCSCGSGI